MKFVPSTRPASVRPGKNFRAVAIGVVPVNTTPAVAMVKLAGMLVARIGAVGEPALLDAAENDIELLLAD